MDAVIVVESCFGATRATAEEIARGMHGSGMGAVVRSFLVRTGSRSGLADGEAAPARARGSELARG